MTLERNKNETKVCRGCHSTHKLTAFHKHPSTRDRLQPYCKTCTKERTKAYFKTAEGKATKTCR